MIFVTIPALLILKNLDEDDKNICKTFFPPMFGEDMGPTEGYMSKEDKEASRQKYLELKKEYIRLRDRAANAYDFYNLIEKSVLEMEDEEPNKLVTEQDVSKNSMTKEELQKMC